MGDPKGLGFFWVLIGRDVRSGEGFLGRRKAVGVGANTELAQ